MLKAAPNQNIMVDTTDNFFYINVIGQINSCWFPVGCDSSKLYCRYDITAGADWQVVSGLTSGITQHAQPAAGRFEEIVFNMPIEVMHKSTNPFGCKQIRKRIQNVCIYINISISFRATNDDKFLW